MKVIFSLKFKDIENTPEQFITAKFLELVLGLKITHCEGKYLGKKEYSLMVDEVGNKDIDLIKRIAKQFKQESILLVNDADKRAYLFYFDTEITEHIGQWTETTKEVAETKLGYTRDLESDKYFIVG